MPKKKPKEVVVIDLGGSIVFPDFLKINKKFLAGFKKLVQSQSEKQKFIVVIGGGKTCRFFQEQAKQLGIKDNQSLDWIGIKTTMLNAEILKHYLGSLSFPEILTKEDQKVNWEKGVLLSSGWHPGNSTDLIAFKLAKRFGAKKILIATNIDYIYEKDIKIHKNAKKIEKLSWKDYLSLISGQKWKAGLSIPIDPKAAKLGQKEALKALLFEGTDLKNFKKALLDEDFLGTSIS